MKKVYGILYVNIDKSHIFIGKYGVTKVEIMCKVVNTDKSLTQNTLLDSTKNLPWYYAPQEVFFLFY